MQMQIVQHNIHFVGDKENALVKEVWARKAAVQSNAGPLFEQTTAEVLEMSASDKHVSMYLILFVLDIAKSISPQTRLIILN